MEWDAELLLVELCWNVNYFHQPIVNPFPDEMHINNDVLEFGVASGIHGDEHALIVRLKDQWVLNYNSELGDETLDPLQFLDCGGERMVLQLCAWSSNLTVSCFFEYHDTKVSPT